MYEDWFIWTGYLVLAILDAIGPIAVFVAMWAAGYAIPAWAIGAMAGWIIGGVFRERREMKKTYG